MKTTFVEKTNHERPDGTDYFKLQMEEIFKTMFNNAQETRLSFIAEVVVFMALNIVIAAMVVCFFFSKSIHARFNAVQWTGEENLTVKCAVLMGLLQKNTTITDITFQPQHQRIARAKFMNQRITMLDVDVIKALGVLLKVNTTIRSLNLSSFMNLILLQRKKGKNDE